MWIFDDFSGQWIDDMSIPGPNNVWEWGYTESPATMANPQSVAVVTAAGAPPLVSSGFDLIGTLKKFLTFAPAGTTPVAGTGASALPPWVLPVGALALIYLVTSQKAKR